MTPRGLEPLVAMRQAKVLPGREVLLWFGDFKPARWVFSPTEFSMPEGVCTAKSDFRVLVGLDVILVGNRYDRAFVTVFEKINQIARSVLAIPLDQDGDMQLWKKGEGVVQL